MGGNSRSSFKNAPRRGTHTARSRHGFSPCADGCHLDVIAGKDDEVDLILMGNAGRGRTVPEIRAQRQHPQPFHLYCTPKPRKARGVVVQLHHALERAVLVIELANIKKGQLFEPFGNCFRRNLEFVSNRGLPPSNFVLHLNISQQTLCPLAAPMAGP